MNKLKAIWKIEELRGKILVTLLLLLAFRLGCCLPVPFVSNTALDAMFSNNKYLRVHEHALRRCAFRSAFFALGVSPYINASIITQLLCVALPSWEALQKETTGKDKLDEYTKRIALAMAVVMSVGYYFVLRNYGALKYTAGKSISLQPLSSSQPSSPGSRFPSGLADESMNTVSETVCHC